MVQLVIFIKLQKRVSLFSDINRMNANNLAIVFAPNILRAPPKFDELSLMEDTPFSNTLLRLLIENFDEIFQVIWQLSNCKIIELSC